jgi:hypothetical protein
MPNKKTSMKTRLGNTKQEKTGGGVLLKDL